ncbi:SGT1 transcription factor [Phycomyces blakesleeanus NRRL 1555(-)]|uniref:SGT1 transcription factor n=2 Tax=Phycomyces blakesleeanus TaxID=4837 RepID=A0A163EH07_PHYB8|nr:SGT1 transcription factor [Phycomyces blakesleeanus NRRL 1555(-)]OAD78580.1 SGT1 transcription factor [Phycomyces blakesleeanus NRRL 1555(-)]|eukprot:XP_018296620.1 SGT1 transcription factor [Phycomyces blakesleeanus NRRL 1555(-)]
MSKEVDYVQYSIYLPPKQDKQSNLKMLRETCALIHSQLQNYLDGYLWQKDRFNLCIAYDEKNDPSYPFLHGVARFGDCINDEWFIVFLLRQISVQLPEAVITIADNDGDVLLIEAAMELPSWLDPTNSQNRVYVHKGKVHIIPLPTTPAEIMQIPSVGKLGRTQAITIVRQSLVPTEASFSVQAIIQERIKGYPRAAKEEIHRARCILPKQAAFVLLKSPELLPLAIEAFYLREPISLKACAKMNQFSPIHNNVDSIVKFTKTTYAQTVSQKFYAPKPFHLPPITKKKEFNAAELGMKVACGLEMLYADERTNQTEEQEKYRFDLDPAWKEFVSNLGRLGYFRGEREGSHIYRQLEEQAKEQFLQSKKNNVIAMEDLDIEDNETFSGGSVLGQISPRALIDKILKEYSEDALVELLKTEETEDSDEWMNVDPKQLEDLLAQKMGKMKEKMMGDIEQDLEEDNEDGEVPVDLEKIMAQFESFVEGSRSGVDGVEFPGGNDGSDEESDDSDDEGADRAISFDTDRFMNILKGVLELPEELKKDPVDVDGNMEDTEDMDELMREMDKEISGHEKINASFEKSKQDIEEDEDSPVDIQLNLVKNVLESFKSQQGLPGPAGNILRQFGVVLPADNEEDS